MMGLIPLEGFLIPGLSFQDRSIWVLYWPDNPTPFRKMAEVWVLHHDGRKVCYLDPGEADAFFRKYHAFDEVLPADITIRETNGGLEIQVERKAEIVVQFELRYRASLKSRIINMLIRCSSSKRFGTKGRTETGMQFHNLPQKLVPVSVERAVMDGSPLGRICKPQMHFNLGDGKPSDEPMIVYCTHLVEGNSP